MADYVQVATKDQVPPGKTASAWTGERQVLVYSVDGEYYATDEAKVEGNRILVGVDTTDIV